MSEPKTVQNDGNVDEFLDAVENPRRREDARRVLELMREVTGEPPKMWGSSIVGFGSYRYKYASGREGDWMITGFSPRKQNLTVYIMPGFSEFADLLARLGKHKTSKSCLYLNKLDDVDLDMLAELVRESVAVMRKRYGQERPEPK
ncbi:MAG: DUF1801 domain-containing protein [Gammaproteobacteria bacterium]|nr:DUF1801 domain-containing protein [Gammaproteobacteria bacterium]MYH47738.1 DUF1801 domain-containing protein [Gammaproteobacteria bacterium]MYL14277.1 DUF1801 domain-containing protein [Gammaproteobacteria bacterium]